MIHWLDYKPEEHDEALVLAALTGEKSPFYMSLRGDCSTYDMLCLAADIGLVSKPSGQAYLKSDKEVPMDLGYDRKLAHFGASIIFEVKVPFLFVATHVEGNSNLGVNMSFMTDIPRDDAVRHFSRAVKDGVAIPSYITRRVTDAVLYQLRHPDLPHRNWFTTSYTTRPYTQLTDIPWSSYPLNLDL